MASKTDFEALLNSSERNRKKKDYFPDKWLIRGYKEEAAYDIAYKFFSKTISEDELKKIKICTVFNTDFWLIRGYSKDEALNKVSEIQRKNSLKFNDKYTPEERRKFYVRCIEYYLEKGLTEEEARRALADSQRTFTLEKCVEKYGKDGYAVWENRQIQWQRSMNEKSSSEKDEINKKRNVFNLENCIRLYGPEEGEKHYKKNFG